MKFASGTYSIILFPFIVLVTGCSNEITIELETDPGQSVAVGETIVVIADGNFNTKGITWYSSGIRVYSCDEEATCPFSSSTAGTAQIKVIAAGDVQEDRGLVYSATSLVTESGDPPEDAQKSITLFWTE